MTVGRTAAGLLAFCMALALPAAAGQAAPRQNAGLRGAKPADAPMAGFSPIAAPSQAPTPTPSPTRTADQCRAACAQSYYFCLAGDAPETCPDAWSQCRVGCGVPAR